MAGPAQPRSASERSAAIEWALWIALYLALRAALALSLGDVFFYGEELAKAAAGRTLGAGTGLAWHELPYVSYEGGGFFFSHLDRLAFECFGPSLAALKLVPLVWGALVLAASCWLATLFFDRSTARWFAAFLVFAPASFQKISLLSLGIHFEALAFVATILALAVRIALSRDDRTRTWLALGASIGFGAWFSYSTLPASAYALGLIAVKRRDAFTVRAATALLFGGALGALPLVWMLANQGGDVLRVHGEDLFGAMGVSGAWRVLESHARAVFGGRSAPEFAAMLVLPATAVVALALLVRARPSDRRTRERAVAGYLLVFAAVYLFSGFAEPSLEHGFHLKRASQLWYFAALLCAASLSRWFDSGRTGSRIAALAIGVVLLASGAIDTIAIARAGGAKSLAHSWQVLRSTKGYAWTSYVRSLEPRIAGDSEEKLQVLARLPEPDREWLFPSIADAVWLTSRAPLDEVLRICESAGGGHAPALLRGLGTWWRRLEGPDIRARWRRASTLPPALAQGLLEGIGRDAVGPRVTEEILRAEIARGLDRELSKEFFVGVGSRIPECLGDLPSSCPIAHSARPWLLHRELAEAFLAAQDPRVRDALREGCERGYAERALAAKSP
jgi:hypothetical protein